ncbi:hypothetical protein LMG29542_07144 [Paraburkholderia humisilvae]|uniref:Uncharacterized protein n=1 Tax=Paraburkholderia humisilvae TaxID=627669 RepID=A0A6J5F2Z2_9BURK|nr:hypothetical protein LMG29542_07144 [Paraburkholderia humisilvae]
MWIFARSPIQAGFLTTLRSYSGSSHRLQLAFPEHSPNHSALFWLLRPEPFFAPPLHVEPISGHHTDRCRIRCGKRVIAKSGYARCSIETGNHDRGMSDHHRYGGRACLRPRCTAEKNPFRGKMTVAATTVFPMIAAWISSSQQDAGHRIRQRTPCMATAFPIIGTTSEHSASHIRARRRKSSAMFSLGPLPP